MNLEDQELSALIRQQATRHRAPDSLRAAIRTQTALEDARRAPAGARGEPNRRLGRWFTFGWGTASVSFALGMLCMVLLLPLVQRIDFGEPVETELVRHHVRALQVGPVTEVASSDRHTVKPWFQGRVDYAPPVFDLATDGFPLLGGRIEHVRGQRVATLAYAHNRHVIDVFIWPSSTTQAPARRSSRGFSVVTWSDESMQYWVVSDTDRQEMESFVKFWQQRAQQR